MIRPLTQTLIPRTSTTLLDESIMVTFGFMTGWIFGFKVGQFETEVLLLIVVRGVPADLLYTVVA